MKDNQIIRPGCVRKASIGLMMLFSLLPVSGQTSSATSDHQDDKISLGKAKGRGEAVAFATNVKKLAVGQKMSKEDPASIAVLHPDGIEELMKEDESFRTSSRKLLTGALDGNAKTKQECETICHIAKALVQTRDHDDLALLHGIYMNVSKADTLQEVRLLHDLCEGAHAELISAGLVPESSYKRSRVYKQLIRREWSLSQNRK